jgi:hypothetical protein
VRRRLANRIRNKQRYAEDPEYRQRVLEYRQQRYANDPEYRQRSLEYRQQGYANDPDYRQNSLDYHKKYTRRPDKRDAAKALARAHKEKHREKANAYALRFQQEDLGRRRATNLYSILQHEVADKYTWKTHTPIRYPDRVDHHCTGCNRERFLIRGGRRNHRD